MAGYWNQVAKAAFADSRKLLKIDSGTAIVVLIGSQFTVALILSLLTGDMGFASRLATVTAPFWMLAPVFLWKFIETPPRLHSEAYQKIARLEAKPNEITAKMEGIYIELGRFQRSRVTPDNVGEYLQSLEEYVRSESVWLKDQIGESARERFLDTTSANVGFLYDDAVNQEHNSAILALNEFRKNIRSMIDRRN